MHVCTYPARTIHSIVQATCDGHACITNIFVVYQRPQSFSSGTLNANENNGLCQLSAFSGGLC